MLTFNWTTGMVFTSSGGEAASSTIPCCENSSLDFVAAYWPIRSEDPTILVKFSAFCPIAACAGPGYLGSPDRLQIYKFMLRLYL